MPHPFFVNNQQGAFSHAPSILYNKNHLFSKNQDFQPKKKKNSFNLETRSIRLCLIQVRSPISRPVK